MLVMWLCVKGSENDLRDFFVDEHEADCMGSLNVNLDGLCMDA